MLFHEIYGSYYQTTAAVLKEAVRGTLTGKKLSDLIREGAFGESFLTIPEGLQGERWRLLHRDLTTPLLYEPDMPLTDLEKRWMKAVLMDRRVRLFDPDMTGLEDVEPLFMPDQIVYYDRYTSGDPFEDPGYIRNFRTVLQALREGTGLSVTFRTGGGKLSCRTVCPCFLEYSEKDDRFRLIAAERNDRVTINLCRMESCTPEQISFPVKLRRAGTASVTFELENRRNALERVLLHFSHLEKETRRANSGKYLVTLKYDPQDETEMIIRILSFGPLVRVTAPDRFIALLRERIRKQLAYMDPAEGT